MILHSMMSLTMCSIYNYLLLNKHERFFLTTLDAILSCYQVCLCLNWS